MNQENKSNLYKKVYNINTLDSAWRKVLSNASQSNSKATYDAIKEFSKTSSRSIRKIKHLLKEKNFKFLAEGIPLKEKKKSSRRPVTNFSIESRIVNRAILDVLQLHRPIKEKYLSVRTSYGGVPDKSVAMAINHLEEMIENGAKYYIKSDMKEFFTTVSVDSILQNLKNDISDKAFLKLLENALKVEVSNYSSLKGFERFYNFNEIGIPQGSSLSPLIANVFLYDFDLTMNKHDSTCIRFLDDFIILSPSRKIANLAFKRAKSLLKKQGLSVYELTDKKKAFHGYTDSEITFLGITYLRGVKKPNEKNINQQYQHINKALCKCLSAEFSSFDFKEYKYSAIKTLNYIDNKIQGWANGYKFCNDRNYRERFDSKINDMLVSFATKLNNRFACYISKKQVDKLRRHLGVFVVKDT